MLPLELRPVHLVFFDGPETLAGYTVRYDILRDTLRRYYGTCCPVWSYIAQRPADGRLTMEAYCTSVDAELHYRQWKGHPYILHRTPKCTLLYAAGFTGKRLTDPVHVQADEAFQRLRSLLRHERIPLHCIVRQWNYIERITDVEHHRQRYQDFNDARSKAYATTHWPEGYPAATGIGTHTGGIRIDLHACIPSPPTEIIPINNTLQTAAHAYSRHVLHGGPVGRPCSTPKFERAKLLRTAEKPLLLISGTAAIRGEQSATDRSPETQLRITLENIGQLVSQAETHTRQTIRLQMLRIYVKRDEDTAAVAACLHRHPPGCPYHLVIADICRPELQLEIESWGTVQEQP